jgi:hypothetical protein
MKPPEGGTTNKADERSVSLPAAGGIFVRPARGVKQVYELREFSLG